MRVIAGAILQQKIQASTLVPEIVTEIVLEEVFESQIPEIPTEINAVYEGKPEIVTEILLEEII